MSTTANWSYANVATVKPFVSRDDFDGETTYGTEYEIACTFIGKVESRIDDIGNEYISRTVIWTEDERPKRLDLIKLNGESLYHEIRNRTRYDMSFFGENDDYELVI